MGIEIERKFTVDVSNLDVSLDTKSSRIMQGYLSTDPERTVRIRTIESEDRKGYITIKGKNKGFSRKEYEYEIPFFEALAMLDLCNYKLSKTRFYLEGGWELDVFTGRNNGLFLAEKELTSEDDCIKLPSWIDEEVTNDYKYSNSHLAKFPYETWGKNQSWKDYE